MNDDGKDDHHSTYDTHENTNENTNDNTHEDTHNDTHEETHEDTHDNTHGTEHVLLDAMELQHSPDESVRSLPEAIVSQLEKHLNIKTTANDLMDSLVLEIKNYRSEYDKSF